MKNFNGNWKIMLFLLLLLAAAVTPLFADGLDALGMGKIETLGNTVKAIFTGALVKTILVCCLCGCAIAYGFNKDNEQMKKKIIAIAIAIALLVAAQTIVDKVWEAAN